MKEIVSSSKKKDYQSKGKFFNIFNFKQKIGSMLPSLIKLQILIYQNKNINKFDISK
jgi:hypothetical protein